MPVRPPINTGQWTKRVLVIIPAASRAVADEAMRTQVDPRRRDDPFTRKLSPTGNDPATHYIKSMQATPAMLATFRSHAGFLTASVVEWDMDNDYDSLNTILSSRGLQFIEPPITPP